MSSCCIAWVCILLYESCVLLSLEYDYYFYPRFKHPHSGKILEFSCPPPDDFTEVLDELRRVTSADGQNGDGVVQ